jgi:hypothetical protein
LTRPSSTELAVGLLIDFDYAQHLQLNEDASAETVVTTTGNSFLNVPNTDTSPESFGVLIPSPNVTASAKSSGDLIPSLSSSTSAAGSFQAAFIPEKKDANDVGKGRAENQRTVSSIFRRWGNNN